MSQGRRNPEAQDNNLLKACLYETVAFDTWDHTYVRSLFMSLARAAPVFCVQRETEADSEVEEGGITTFRQT
jgi:hypothetical protein